MTQLAQLTRREHWRLPRKAGPTTVERRGSPQRADRQDQPADRRAAQPPRDGHDFIPAIAAGMAVVNLVNPARTRAAIDPGHDRGGEIMHMDQRNPGAWITGNRREAPPHGIEQRGQLAIARTVDCGRAQHEGRRRRIGLGQQALHGALAQRVVRQRRLARGK